MKQILLGIAVLSGAIATAQGPTDTTNIDPSIHGSWPAGPYSAVSTAYQVLQTRIPIVHLDGPGRSSLDFYIYHRSATEVGALPTYNAGVGQGFLHNLNAMFFNGGTEVRSDNQVNEWYSSLVGQDFTYTRKPGCRADAVQITGGFAVTDQDTKIKRIYTLRYPTTAGQYYLTSTVDACGNATTLTYDMPGPGMPIVNPRVKTVTNAGRTLTLNYQSNAGAAQVASVTLATPNGNRTWEFVYAYTVLGGIRFPHPVTGLTNTSSPDIEFFYNGVPGDGNIVSIRDLNNNRWGYSYGMNNGHPKSLLAVYPPSEANPDVPSTLGTLFSWVQHWAASPSYTRCTITDRLLYEWKVDHYDSYAPNLDVHVKKPVARVYQPSELGESEVYTEFLYAQLGKPLNGAVHAARNANNVWTDFHYPPNDNTGLPSSKVEMVDDGVTRTTSYIYSNFRLIQTTDPAGFVHTQSWDYVKDLLLTKTVDLYGASLTTTYSYMPNGEIISEQVGQIPTSVRSNFDTYGNALTITAPNGQPTAFAFDAFGNKTAETPPAPLGQRTFTYDYWGRLTNTTFPNGYGNVSTAYDWNSNVVSTTSETGNTAINAYDEQNRLKSTTQPVDGVAANNLVTTFLYDANGRLVETRHPKWTSTSNQYKTTRSYLKRGPLHTIVYPDGRTRRYEYDWDNNLTFKLNGRSQPTFYEYDLAGRLKKIDYTVAGMTDVTFGYRHDDVRTSMIDGTGTTTWTYNGAKQLTSTYQPLTQKRIDYTYLPNDGRAHETKLGNSTLSAIQQTWTNSYDSAGRLFEVRQTAGAPILSRYSYNNANLVNNYKLGPALTGSAFVYNGTIGYDARGRVTSLGLTGPDGAGTMIDNSNYALELDGDLQGLTRSYGSSTAPMTSSATYTHDKASRITSEAITFSGQSQFNTSNTYAYDKNGNRSSVVRNGTTYPYTVDYNDKFLTGEGYSVSVYDNDGNPLTLTVPGQGTWALSWDSDSRLTRIIRNNGTTTYRYDGLGNRVERNVGGTGAAITRYVYSGDQEIAETDGANIFTMTQSPGVGFVKGTTQYYVHTGLNGSALWTGTGAQSGNRISFDAYGLESNLLGSKLSDYRFGAKHGYVSDGDTSFMLLGARYYSARLGRFLSQDPIGHEGGLNLYAYCDNSPLLKVDPDGRDGITILGFEFSGEVWSNGLRTGLGAVGESFSFGLYRDDYARSQVGYGGSRVLAEVGKEVLIAAGTAGAGQAIQSYRLGRVVVATGYKATKANLIKSGVSEGHHLLPKQFVAQFRRAGLNIDDFIKPMDRSLHKLLHGKGGGELFQKSWNKQWEMFFKKFPNASKHDILLYQKKMVKAFGL